MSHLPPINTNSNLTSADKKSTSPNVVGVHYRVGRKIGEGSFGVIYEGLNLLNNSPVAIKFEPRKSDAPQLRDEYRTYKILQDCPGIPIAHYFGQEGLHNILCIDLLGPSLEDMFDLCGRKFSIKTTCMVAKQMITRIQTIHDHNLIYRDIKPDNFLIGRIPKANELETTNVSDPNGILINHFPYKPHPASQIYIVDFGMAKQYRDPKTHIHIPYREKKSLSGTARYMSINTHLGREQSRRDDLEALGHVFMYFLRGSLPWQGLKAATNKQKYEKIGEKKQNVSVQELCSCQGFQEFGTYLEYARTLKFEEEPDYDYCRGLMDKVLLKLNATDDGVFDWMIAMDNQRKERDRLRSENSKDKGVSAATIGVNSSVAANHMNSAHPSNSAIMDGMSQVAASSQHVSPRREMISSSQGRSQGGFDRNQRMSDFSSPNTPGKHPNEQSPARGQHVGTRKKKWWKKLFRWCGRNDSDIY